jgi:hypothetical protein
MERWRSEAAIFVLPVQRSVPEWLLECSRTMGVIVKSSFIYRSLALVIAAGWASGASAADNVFTIVVANGPFAGTYKAGNVICMHAKSQDVFSAGFKDFGTVAAKAMGEGGAEVEQPDAPGAKFGSIKVSFGPDGKQTSYSIVHEPITLIMKGKAGHITFDGKTKKGIKLHVEAQCDSVEQL